MRFVTLDMGGVVQPIGVPDSFIAYRIDKIDTKAVPQVAVVTFLNLRTSDGNVTEVFNKAGSGFIPTDYSDSPDEPQFRAGPLDQAKHVLNFERTTAHGAWNLTQKQQAALQALTDLIERITASDSTAKDDPTSGSAPFAGQNKGVI